MLVGVHSVIIHNLAGKSSVKWSLTRKAVVWPNDGTMKIDLKQFQMWGAAGGRIRAHRLTKARMRQIARMGVKARKKKVGRPPKDVRAKTRKSYYVPTGKPKGYPSRIDLVQAKAMYRKGDTLEKIGIHFKVTRERVRQVLRKHGILADEDGQAIRSFIKITNRVGTEKQLQERRERAVRKRWGLSLDNYLAMCNEYGTTSVSTSPFYKFKQQKASANARGIDWKLNFAEWWEIWTESGKWLQRGRGHGKYVMSRFGDSGAYAIGNVAIIEADQNGRDTYLVKQPYRSSKGVLRRSERGLTAAMESVVALYEQGLTISQIAKKRGVQYGVAHNQIRGAQAIMEKLKAASAK